MLLDRIRKLNIQIEKILKKKLEDFNLSIGQWEVLNAIYKSSNNKISAVELEKKLNVDKRLLSLSLKKLEELAYIQRVDLPQDKRKKHIILTTKALEIAEDLSLIEYELNDVIISNLETENVINFENNINLAKEALKEYDEE